MSLFKERFVKRSTKKRRCLGCDNFVTINAGDSYYSCFYAEGSEAGSYALCVPCYEHWARCRECQEATREGSWGIRECREQEAQQANETSEVGR